MNTDILQFQSDYQEACHENILKRLTEEYRKPYPGYGSDNICEAAKEKNPKGLSLSRRSGGISGGRHPDQCYGDRLLPPFLPRHTLCGQRTYRGARSRSH